jgi:NTP pyrophosphatase (non-canonical NTP hydrolase)
MKINDLVKQAHENALSKGWWEEDRTFGEIIALMHSELSEALEDFRNGFMPHDVWYEKKIDGEVQREVEQIEKDWKPCGIPSELADVVIRVFDACGRYEIDLEAAITEKMAYNATRPQRHGGKKI